MSTAAKEPITESSNIKKRQLVYSKAGIAAYRKALQSKAPVCFTEGTVIYKVFPSGRKMRIGEVNPPVKIVKKAFCI
ncbi:hypothetical protein IKQ19_10245 [Candidatus Saccharibacteria bacterium]|nr:hypothetical protein [Candidatus Saccharibacteria bacterium]